MTLRESVPAELRVLSQWVTRKGKKPFTPGTCQMAKAGDPSTWRTYEEAERDFILGKCDGIGFQFHNNGIVGIDLDRVLNTDTGELADWAADIVDRLDSYTEISPSGTGLHIFVKGRFDGRGRKKSIGDGQAVEMYQEKRYFTVTGNVFRPAPIQDRPEVTELYNEFFPAPPNVARSVPTAAYNASDTLQTGLEKDPVFRALWEGERPTGDESNDDLSLMNKLAYWCNLDTARMMEAFIDSPYTAGKDPAHAKKAQREDYLRRTAEKAAADCTRTAAADNEAYQSERAVRAFGKPGQGSGQGPEGSGSSGVPSFFDGKRFQHHVMGDYLIQKLHACKINGAVHIYENGVYRPGEEALHGHMIQLVPSLIDARRKEVYKYIKVSPSTPEKELAPPELIPFATRIYNIETGAFLDYGPKHVFLNRFPYDYKPDAPALPIVDETLEAITCGDAEVKQLLMEAIGNCFFLLNQFRGAVMLYGSGNNGKSTLLNMITQLLGKENASHLSLQDLAERFRLMEIYGKAANIGDDIPGTYIPDSSWFKKAVTGEYLTAEKKGQDPISFKPFAKMFFAMNALPSVSDKSKGFFSRVLLVPLNQDFSRLPTRNPGLKDRKWTQEEMEYLTRLAVDGLRKLKAQGDFTRPQVVQEAVEEYERENNPVKEFLEEYRESGEAIEDKPTGLIYDSFTFWCQKTGHKNPMSRRKFTTAVCCETGLQSGVLWGNGNGKSVRCFTR